MADEEVDILGDFKLELDSQCYASPDLVQHSDLLPSPEMPHPWLLDSPSAWYLDHVDERSRMAIEKMLQEERQTYHVLGSSPPATSLASPSGTDQWREEAASASGVEVFDDNQIPTSVEEVITAVTTGQTTVPVIGERKRKRDGGKTKKVKVQTKVPAKTTRSPAIHEEIVRIRREEQSDSEEEIDIDDFNSDMVMDNYVQKAAVVTNHPPVVSETPSHPLAPDIIPMAEEPRFKDRSSHQELIEQILQLPAPTCAVELDYNRVSEQEKEVHSEFFEGRPTKTEERYLRIRNHILECWRRCRPQYVTKTSVRPGLKNCGDVNCIGRIHSYLEQIGAINFGCDMAQYNRPTVPSVVYSKSVDEFSVRMFDTVRPRKKKGILDICGEGGITMQHNEMGEVVESKVFPEAPARGGNVNVKPKRDKSDPFKLIRCCEFGPEKPAPYAIQLEIGALLVMDIHSHACHTEVIGLLGGYYRTAECRLEIVCAEPCRSISTGIQCEMCPVSQYEAGESLRSRGLEVIGWYHSHPTFLPNPSVRDLETQHKFQQYFAQKESPFVGIIVSPYSSVKSLASTYRCLIVTKEESFDVPYSFDMGVSCDYLTEDIFIKSLRHILDTLNNCPSIVPLQERYRQSELTYLNKMVESGRIHMSGIVPSHLSELVVSHLSRSFNELFADDFK